MVANYKVLLALFGRVSFSAFATESDVFTKDVTVRIEYRTLTGSSSTGCGEDKARLALQPRPVSHAGRLGVYEKEFACFGRTFRIGLRLEENLDRQNHPASFRLDVLQDGELLASLGALTLDALRTVALAQLRGLSQALPTGGAYRSVNPVITLLRD